MIFPSIREDMPVRFISNKARSRDSEGSHRIRITHLEKRTARTKDIKAAYEKHSNPRGHTAPDHDERKEERMFISLVV